VVTVYREKICSVNIIPTEVLRGIWLTRNDFVSKQQVWSDVKLTPRKILRLTLERRIIHKESKMVIFFGKKQILEPLKIGSG
jgi:hypothetical protein